MISGFRSADGLRIKQQTKRRMSWHEREDGMVEFRARLPKEEAALLLAAINAARDQFGPPPPKPDPCGAADQQSAPGVGLYSNADALVDVACGFLNTAPEDRSGEDRAMVVVHVSAENLGRTVPDVPAGTPEPAEAVCHIEGVGSVEAATAQKARVRQCVVGCRRRQTRQGPGRGPQPSAGQQGATPGADDSRQDVLLSGLPSDPAFEGASSGAVESGWPDRFGQFDLAVPVASHHCP
jgi:hypothetical protein